MITRRTTALVAVCLGSLAVTATAQAAFPGTNGKISFSQTECIYSVNPDGSGKTPATPCDEQFQAEPAWAADGVRMAYEGPNGIEYVTNGQNSTAVFDFGNQFGFAWSPDGARLVAAYTTLSGDDPQVQTSHLVTLKPDGSDLSQVLTSTSSFYVDPAWSPSGKKIAAADYRSAFTVNPDGSGMTTVAPGGIRLPNWSPDGFRLAFARAGDIWSINPDGGGETQLTSSGQDTSPAWSPDGRKIAFQSHRDGNFEIYVMNADGTSQTNITNTPTIDERDPDWQPIPYTGYARPRGATPLRTFLVPAYKQCIASNSTHGAPLSFPSCNPPQQTSDWLTVGTPDANGQGAKSAGVIRYGVIPGNPSTPADEADIEIVVSITDVRKKSDLSDYTGQLRVLPDMRITDRDDSPNPTGTVQDIPMPTDVSCVATADLSIGGECKTTTTFEALVPGAVKERKRATWELGQIQVYDGGPDGNPTTADNTLFAVQGVFVP